VLQPRRQPSSAKRLLTVNYSGLEYTIERGDVVANVYHNGQIFVFYSLVVSHVLVRRRCKRSVKCPFLMVWLKLKVYAFTQGWVQNTVTINRHAQ
jgi:hypothetical protein